jgi:predicted metalloprotease
MALGGIGMLVVVVMGLLMGVDPQALLQEVNRVQQAAPQQEVAPNPADDELKQFVSVVLANTENVWQDLFRRAGMEYRKPKLVLFTGEVSSACGFASAAVGPFYCPADDRVYLDLSFYRELEERFDAPGDFAQAYVIAHEIGHHVQNLLGISERVSSMRRRVSEEEYNKLSVRLELQADYFAGVWAHHAEKMRHILEAGDIEEALRCASAIGDDRLQKQAQGYVVPDSFTHGTSAQRARWFRRGLESGDMRGGDTFSAKEL